MFRAEEAPWKAATAPALGLLVTTMFNYRRSRSPQRPRRPAAGKAWCERTRTQGRSRRKARPGADSGPERPSRRLRPLRRPRRVSVSWLGGNAGREAGVAADEPRGTSMARRQRHPRRRSGRQRPSQEARGPPVRDDPVPSVRPHTVPHPWSSPRLWFASPCKVPGSERAPPAPAAATRRPSAPSAPSASATAVRAPWRQALASLSPAGVWSRRSDALPAVTWPDSGGVSLGARMPSLPEL